MPTKELEAQAVHCFRNVTGFMGDRDSKKEETGHAEKLIRTCLHAPEELRDEVFCQIIKQTTGNPSPESALKGWMLLGICAGAIAPSRDFEKYLLSYCETHANESQSIGDYAKFTIGRIIKTAALSPRRETPLPMEVEAAKMRLPVLLRVFHLDGSFDMMPINSWVTPAVLKAMICEKRGIKNGDAFGIYEMTPNGEERFLEPEERLLDLVAYWQRLFEEERSKTGEEKKARKKALGNTSFYRVVFKVHMYFDVVRAAHARARARARSQSRPPLRLTLFPCPLSPPHAPRPRPRCPRPRSPPRSSARSRPTTSRRSTRCTCRPRTTWCRRATRAASATAWRWRRCSCRRRTATRASRTLTRSSSATCRPSTPSRRARASWRTRSASSTPSTRASRRRPSSRSTWTTSRSGRCTARASSSSSRR
jgi:hypothetical protein